MAKRHKDAIFIQGGACNPTPIAKTLWDACLEASREGKVPREDAAVRLIAHQLAFILETRDIDFAPLTYARLVKECEERQGEA